MSKSQKYFNSKTKSGLFLMIRNNTQIVKNLKEIKRELAKQMERNNLTLTVDRSNPYHAGRDMAE